MRYKVTLFYGETDDLHCLHIYGAYLDGKTLEWLSSFPDIHHILVENINESNNKG